MDADERIRAGRVDPLARLRPLTEAIIGAAFEVSNQLGHGYLEAVYQRALAYELEERGLSVTREVPFSVFYKGQEVGTYIADLIVNQAVVVELKAVEALVPAHTGQLLNYLKASRLPLGLLINFGRPKIEIRRVAA